MNKLIRIHRGLNYFTILFISVQIFGLITFKINFNLLKKSYFLIVYQYCVVFMVIYQYIVMSTSIRSFQNPEYDLNEFVTIFSGIVLGFGTSLIYIFFTLPRKEWKELFENLIRVTSYLEKNYWDKLKLILLGQCVTYVVFIIFSTVYSVLLDGFTGLHLHILITLIFIGVLQMSTLVNSCLFLLACCLRNLNNHISKSDSICPLKWCGKYEEVEMICHTLHRICSPVNFLFVVLIANQYFIGLYYVFTGQITHSNVKVALVFNSLWLITLFVAFFLSLLAATLVQTEAKKCSQLISIWDCENNYSVGKRVEAFLLKSANFSLKFNVCGFFQWHLKLLITTVAVVASYTILMVQFRNTN